MPAIESPRRPRRGQFGLRSACFGHSSRKRFVQRFLVDRPLRYDVAPDEGGKRIRVARYQPFPQRLDSVGAVGEGQSWLVAFIQPDAGLVPFRLAGELEFRDFAIRRGAQTDLAVARRTGNHGDSQRLVFADPDEALVVGVAPVHPLRLEAQLVVAVPRDASLELLDPQEPALVGGVLADVLVLAGNILSVVAIAGRMERGAEGVFVDLRPLAGRDSALDECLGRREIAAQQKIGGQQGGADVVEPFFDGVGREDAGRVAEHIRKREQVAHGAVVLEAIEPPQDGLGPGALAPGPRGGQALTHQVNHGQALRGAGLFGPLGRHRAEVQPSHDLPPPLAGFRRCQVVAKSVEAAVSHLRLGPVALYAVGVEKRPNGSPIRRRLARRFGTGRERKRDGGRDDGRPPHEKSPIVPEALLNWAISMPNRCNIVV